MAAVPGGRSVGVPGNLRLMWLAHREHGKLPWARLFQPAIRLARGGYAISPRLRNFLHSFKLPIDDWGRSYLYGPDGDAWPVGTVVRNPMLAAQFERIAAKGPEVFYGGDGAAKLAGVVDGAARNPSRMTTADLAAYRAKPRAPICGTYRLYRICGMGPPPSGAIVVLTILKQLERFDMAGLGKDSPIAWHLFADSSRARLCRPRRLHRRSRSCDGAGRRPARSRLHRRAFGADRARSRDRPCRRRPTGRAPSRPRATPIDEHGTTDLAVVDRQGNVAEVTTTIESVAGSGCRSTAPSSTTS